MDTVAEALLAFLEREGPQDEPGTVAQALAAQAFTREEVRRAEWPSCKPLALAMGFMTLDRQRRLVLVETNGESACPKVSPNDRYT